MLDAAGCDVVLVETVGVGQSEVEIAGLADTTLVLLAPGMGDGIQAAKAGILEIGDIYVVNKADRDGADQLRRDLRSMIALGGAARGRAGSRRSSRPSPTRGEGVDEVVAEIDEHRAWLAESGELERAAYRRVRDEIEAIAVTALRRALGRRARAASSSTTSRPRWSPASPTPTPPPTPCWRTCRRSGRHEVTISAHPGARRADRLRSSLRSLG